MEQSIFIERFNVNNIEIPVIAYKGHRVITMKDIDRIHQRPDGTAKSNFRVNRHRLVAGSDYFEIPYDEWTQILNGGNSTIQNHGGYRGAMFFFTEDGYLMLVKSFTDDLAWDVQRRLVNAYFRVQEEEATTRKRKARQKSPLEIMSTAAVRADKLVKVMGLSDPQRILKIGEIVKSETGRDLFAYVGETPPDPPIDPALSPSDRKQAAIDRLVNAWHAKWAGAEVTIKQVATLLDADTKKCLGLPSTPGLGANQSLGRIFAKITLPVGEGRFWLLFRRVNGARAYRLVPVES